MHQLSFEQGVEVIGAGLILVVVVIVETFWREKRSVER